MTEVRTDMKGISLNVKGSGLAEIAQEKKREETKKAMRMDLGSLLEKIRNLKARLEF